MNVKFNNLETERVTLRKFKESDAEAFFKYRPHPQVSLYQSGRWDNCTFEEIVSFVNEQKKLEPDIPGTWFQIAIELKESGTLIGDCAIHTLMHDNNQVEIGFTLDMMYQNKGLAKEAVNCLLDYLFNVLNKHRVIAITDVRNSNSIILLEKIGMRREGHFLKNAFYRDTYTDEYLYAILKEEWLEE